MPQSKIEEAWARLRNLMVIVMKIVIVSPKKTVILPRSTMLSQRERKKMPVLVLILLMCVKKLCYSRSSVSAYSIRPYLYSIK